MKNIIEVLYTLNIYNTIRGMLDSVPSMAHSTTLLQDTTGCLSVEAAYSYVRTRMILSFQGINWYESVGQLNPSQNKLQLP